MPFPQVTGLHDAHVEMQNETVLFKFSTVTHTTLTEIPPPPTPVVHGPFPVSEPEKIAQFVEMLAERYLMDLFEPFQNLDGLKAYRLWSKRVENATGIILRQPRLSMVCRFGIPRNISGHTTRIDIKEGQPFNYETACQLINEKHSAFVQITSKHRIITVEESCDGELAQLVSLSSDPGIKTRGYLRYFDTKKPGYMTLLMPLHADHGFQRRLERATIQVPTAGDAHPFLALESTQCEWGERIETHTFDLWTPLPEAICSVPDTYFAIHRDAEDFMFGQAMCHNVRKFNPAAIVSEHVAGIDLPTLFSPENAESILARLQKFIPECPWNLVPYPEIKADLLGAAFAAR